MPGAGGFCCSDSNGPRLLLHSAFGEPRGVVRLAALPKASQPPSSTAALHARAGGGDVALCDPRCLCAAPTALGESTEKLHAAVRRGDEAEVERLLASGADPNMPTSVAPKHDTAGAAVLFVIDRVANRMPPGGGAARVIRLRLRSDGTELPETRVVFGPDAEALLDPQEMCISNDGSKLFISDAGRHVVAVFDPTSLAWLGSFGGVEHLQIPLGVACGPSGEIFVSDEGLHQIFVFRSAGQKSTYPCGGPYECVGRLGGKGTAPGQYRRPRGLCILGGASSPPAEALLLVVEAKRIQVVSLGGEPLQVLEPAQRTGTLRSVTACWNSSGFAIVSDGATLHVLEHTRRRREVERSHREACRAAAMAEEAAARRAREVEALRVKEEKQRQFELEAALRAKTEAAEAARVALAAARVEELERRAAKGEAARIAAEEKEREKREAAKVAAREKAARTVRAAAAKAAEAEAQKRAKVELRKVKEAEVQRIIEMEERQRKLQEEENMMKRAEQRAANAAKDWESPAAKRTRKKEEEAIQASMEIAERMAAEASRRQADAERAGRAQAAAEAAADVRKSEEYAARWEAELQRRRQADRAAERAAARRREEEEDMAAAEAEAKSAATKAADAAAHKAAAAKESGEDGDAETGSAPPDESEEAAFGGEADATEVVDDDVSDPDGWQSVDGARRGSTGWGSAASGWRWPWESRPSTEETEVAATAAEAEADKARRAEEAKDARRQAEEAEDARRQAEEAAAAARADAEAEAAARAELMGHPWGHQAHPLGKGVDAGTDDEGRSPNPHREDKVAERDAAVSRILAKAPKCRSLRMATGVKSQTSEAEMRKKALFLLRLLHPDFSLNLPLKGTKQHARIEAAFKRLSVMRDEA